MAAADELIQRLNNPETRDEASSQLAAMGAQAIPAIADAIRESKGPAQVLKDVLLRIRGDGAVDAFLSLIRDDDTDVQLAGLEAPGFLGDPRATEPLEAFVADPEQLPVPKSYAAMALGNLGSKGSIPVIAEALESAEGEDKLAIRCAIALAKLGDHRGFPAVAALAEAEPSPIRALAVEALCHVAGPGLLGVLSRALRDEYFEVRRAVVEAMYYLGTQGAIEHLVLAASDEDDTTANNALVYIRRISGDRLESGQDAMNWWRGQARLFSPEVCYRLGAPIRLDALALILQDQGAGFDIVREFSIYTGRVFGADAYVRANIQEVSRQVTALAEQTSGQYAPGGVYKYGVRMDLASLVGAG